jgi:hypothetical protein
MSTFLSVLTCMDHLKLESNRRAKHASQHNAPIECHHHIHQPAVQEAPLVRDSCQGPGRLEYLVLDVRHTKTFSHL